MGSRQNYFRKENLFRKGGRPGKRPALHHIRIRHRHPNPGPRRPDGKAFGLTGMEGPGEKPRVFRERLKPPGVSVGEGSCGDVELWMTTE
jgi:hypothetical protein